MLIRLSPEQIVFIWEKFRPLFISNLIPKVSSSPETVFKVLQSLLTESLQLWAGIEGGEGKLEERVFGFIATSIDTDSITQERNLLLYSIFAIKQIPFEAWGSSLKVLEGFKEQNKCKKLIAYTEIPEIVEITKRLGFKQYTFLTKE